MQYKLQALSFAVKLWSQNTHLLHKGKYTADTQFDSFGFGSFNALKLAADLLSWLNPNLSNHQSKLSTHQEENGSLFIPYKNNMNKKPARGIQHAITYEFRRLVKYSFLNNLKNCMWFKPVFLGRGGENIQILSFDN